MKFRFAIAALAVTSVFAQTTEKRVLTMDGARKVVDAVVAEAQKNHATAVVAVVDDGGNLMALQRVDGTFSAGALISYGKARTAAQFKKPTAFFEDLINKGRTAMTAVNDFTPLRGGVPIEIDGQIVGAVGVSGASSAQQDEQFAAIGAAALKTDPPKVSYFESKDVQDAFGKGAVLFDKSDKYMVHASRREQPGMAEVHTRDADIMYVLDGAATVVTGGTALEAKLTAPDEFRGTGIEGGETRNVKKGDVVIIPAGTPHQFKEVSNPFLYYVVKAR